MPCLSASPWSLLCGAVPGVLLVLHLAFSLVRALVGASGLPWLLPFLPLVLFARPGAGQYPVEGQRWLGLTGRGGPSKVPSR